MCWRERARPQLPRLALRGQATWRDIGHADAVQQNFTGIPGRCGSIEPEARSDYCGIPGLRSRAPLDVQWHVGGSPGFRIRAMDCFRAISIECTVTV